MKYLRKQLTLDDLAEIAGPPICDFCGAHAPEWVYAASRMSTGRKMLCWRWCACPTCAEEIEQDNLSNIINKVTRMLQQNSPVPLRLLKQAADLALGEFRQWAVKVPE
jgi:hypothetical protein